MAMLTQEVVVGIVAYFDVSVLNNDQRITKPNAPTTRNGPFVCFAVRGTKSGWAPLTGTFHKDRVEIKQEWRTGGTQAWHCRASYLNDGSTTYTGDTDAFVDASATTDTFRTDTRQHVSADGVAAIVAEIGRRQGNTLN